VRSGITETPLLAKGKRQTALITVGLRPERVIRNIQRFSNTTSAGVPLALGEAFAQHLHDPQFAEISLANRYCCMLSAAD